MKANIISIYSVLCLSVLSAEEYTFSNLKWGESPEQVIAKLEAENEKYKGVNTEDGRVVFEGVLAGEEYKATCSFIKESKELGVVVIVFHNDLKGFSWEDAQEHYRALSKALQGKYGEPAIVEFFRNPYELGDGYELSALDQGKGKWVRVWPKSGDDELLILGIQALSRTKGVITLKYKSKDLQDAQDKKRAESLEDL